MVGYFDEINRKKMEGDGRFELRTANQKKETPQNKKTKNTNNTNKKQNKNKN
jgi:hypothetical protein